MPPTTLTAQPLRTSAEMRAGVAIYRKVFALPPDDPAVSPRLLHALRHNSGTVLGAFDGDEVIGFTYGFLARDTGTGDLYHYSQLAVIAPEWQGHGVGRLLKRAQRDAVLEQGITRMRWTFDPFRGRTATFNLDVLGAAARWFEFDFYGEEGHGLDRGRPSHRLVAEWDLRASSLGQVPAGWPEPPAGLPVAQPVPDGDDVLLAVPSLEEGSDDPALVATVASTLAEITGRGLAAVSCRPTPEGTFAYRFREAT